ncbi:MAG: hypothetical protein KKE11_01310, partial [Gammaproteobacteria bacterium]|nr:hypothetical protein [Gammaproteobacteria bacterium]
TTSLEVAAGGVTNISGSVITTTGDQTYGNALNILANTVLTGDDISFVTTINGGFGLGIDAAGNTTFGGVIGGTTPLAYLDVTSGVVTNINTNAITTTGTQDYAGDVVLGGTGPVTFATTDSLISFVDSLSGSGQDVNLIGGTGGVVLHDVSDLGDLSLQGTGNKTLAGDISDTTSLDVAAGGTTYINGSSISTTGTQRYKGNVILGGITPVIFNAVNNLIEFVSNLTGGGQEVRLDSGTGETKLKAVDNVGQLKLLGSGDKTLAGDITNTTSLEVAAGGVTNISGSVITTTGDQTYGNALNILANTVLTGDDISFVTTINGGFGLGIDAAGNTTFGGVIGGTTPLAYLDVTSGGTTYISAPSITTTGDQTYGNALILLANTVLTGNDISFDSTINGGFGLGVDAAGDAIFRGVVGGVNALAYLTVDADGSINLNGSGIRTIGSQQYNAPVNLGAATSLTTTGDAGDIIFAGTINGGFALGIDAKGNVIFNDTLGANNALASLIIDTSKAIYIYGGAIQTTGLQYYKAPVYLGADTVLTGSAIGFTSTIDSTDLISPRSLTVNAPGSTIFGGKIGGNYPLLNLTTDAGGMTYLQTPEINTIESQTYGDAVSLNRNLRLNAGKDITFNSTITGPYNLVLDAGGNILFDNNVGMYADSIGAMYIVNANNVTRMQVFMLQLLSKMLVLVLQVLISCCT